MLTCAFSDDAHHVSKEATMAADSSLVGGINTSLYAVAGGGEGEGGAATPTLPGGYAAWAKIELPVSESLPSGLYSPKSRSTEAPPMYFEQLDADSFLQPLKGMAGVPAGLAAFESGACVGADAAALLSTSIPPPPPDYSTTSESEEMRSLALHLEARAFEMYTSTAALKQAKHVIRMASDIGFFVCFVFFWGGGGVTSRTLLGGFDPLVKPHQHRLKSVGRYLCHFMLTCVYTFR